MFSIVHASAIALLLALGQSNGQPFVGKWTCEYFGRTLARLELQDTNGALGGRISFGVFHVDADGKLDIVIEEATSYTPIFDVAVRDGVLSFARDEEDDNRRVETHRFHSALPNRASRSNCSFGSELAAWPPARRFVCVRQGGDETSEEVIELRRCLWHPGL